MKTRILVADGHRLMREGLRHILETREDFCVLAEAADGPEAVRLSIEKKPDIAVLGIRLSRLSGYGAIEQIRKESQMTRCIALSGQDNDVSVEQAFRAGATGYVAGSASSSELIQAVDVVRSGRSYLSPKLTEHVIDMITRPAGKGLSNLEMITTREREVLQLIVEGLSSKEIAAHLRIATKTADSHRAHLMKKLDIHKTAALVRFAIREGLSH